MILLIHQRHHITGEALVVVAHNLWVVVETLHSSIFEQKTLVHQDRISRLELSLIPIGDAGFLLGALLRRLLLELLDGLIKILGQRWAAQTQNNQRKEDSFHTASVLLLGWFGRTPATTTRFTPSVRTSPNR